MPTYEFRCQDCGREFEVFTSISDKEKGLDFECPQCRSKSIEQAFHSFLFFSKGGGSASTSSSSCSSCSPSVNNCRSCGS